MNQLLNKFVAAGLFACISGPVFSNGGESISFGEPRINHADYSSLQRGAAAYMNLCSGCHSLEFQRYNRLAKDIGIVTSDGSVDKELLKNNLMFTAEKIEDQIHSSMTKDDGAKWFGAAPPDLSLETRFRGNDWVYNYLLGFYKDDSRPWGVNNAIFKDVGMPNVLSHLQGEQTAVYRVRTANGEEHKTLAGMKLSKPGILPENEMKNLVNDLVNFMSYVADPVKIERERIGYIVILFLLVLLSFAWALKREYWKDIH